MIRRLALLLVVLLFVGAARERELPSMKCRREIEPRVRCDSHYTWPAIPEWRVYYPDAEPSELAIADTDRGIVVYLTMPREKWARLEMCYPGGCVGALGGWFSGRLRWRALD